jgi:hypothetical protein
MTFTRPRGPTSGPFLRKTQIVRAFRKITRFPHHLVRFRDVPGSSRMSSSGRSVIAGGTGSIVASDYRVFKQDLKGVSGFDCIH